jgi:hypothetical protein
MEKLSDSQLYALVINHDLSQGLKEKALAEFGKRNFSQQYVDELAYEYETIIPSLNTDLSTWEKVRIIVFPFLLPIQAIIANRYISKGNPKKWKQYWKYLTIGWLVWTILVFLVAKFLLSY